jgi:hypothetical protein
MSLRRVPIPAALAIVALLLPASSDAAHLQTAKFRATLEATQSTTWTINKSGSCYVETGSGRQSMKFHQAKRLTLLLSRQVGGPRLLMVKVGGSRTNDIPIAGEMTQTGKVVVTQGSGCPTGKPEGPPVAPPVPDCGTKRFTGTIRATWSPPESYPTLPDQPAPLQPVFWLDEPYTTTSFRVCPSNVPLILFRLTKAALPERKVFGPLPTITLQDKVRKVEQYPAAPEGVRSDSTVAWTLRLRRLPG